MFYSSSRDVLFILSFAILISCGDGDSTVINRTLEDTNLQIISNDESLITGQLFTVQEDLVLGIDEGDPDWQIFGSQVDLTVGREGLMYIADDPSRNIFVVNRDGSLLSCFGGHGAGPGEFGLIDGMWWIGESSEFWVSDHRLLRVTRFTHDGKLIDTIRYGDEGIGFFNIIQVINRQFLGIRSVNQLEFSEIFVLYGFLDEDLHWDRDFKSFLSKRMWQASAIGWSAYPWRIEGRPHLATLMDGRIVISDPNNAWITVYSNNGNPEVRFARDWIAPTIKSTEKEEINRLIGSIATPRYQKNFIFPKTRPPFRNLRVDDKLRIWIQRTRSAQAEQVNEDYVFDIFDVKGQWIATQKLAFIPHVIMDGFIYDIVAGTDENGPRVIRYKLLRNH